jgi:hypothetical protein
MTSNEGDKASLTAVMPVHQQRQWPHCDESKNCHCNNSKDVCTSMATTLAWQWATRATTLMMTTMPLWQGQHRQLEDSNNAIATMATMLWINGDDTIVTRAITPAWQRQGCLRINNGYNAIVMRETIIIAMVAKMPVHQWQRYHHNKGDNTNLTSRDEGVMLVWQWQRCLCINDGNNSIVTRATIAITTMEKMPAHWRQQCHLNEGNNASLTTRDNKSNNACMHTHANNHIICSGLHTPLQTYHIFQLAISWTL